MNFGFPTRFLKKLDIYQQIRSGQGISKHKKLWRYEEAFLKTAYGPAHQHLNSPVSLEQAKEWIKRSDSEYDGREYQETLGNLFWRGYIRIVEVKKIDEENEESRILPDDEAAALRNKKLAHGTGKDKNIEHKFLLTEAGLLVGEVVSETENIKVILKLWNKYVYSFAIDTFWLLIFFGFAKIFFSEKLESVLSILRITKVHIFGIDLGYNYILAVFIFVEWPLICFIYREIYSAIERRD